MDVRLPDGTVIQGVPDGMSKADLVSKLSANGYDTSGLMPKAEKQPLMRQDAPVGGASFDPNTGEVVIDDGSRGGQATGLDAFVRGIGSGLGNLIGSKSMKQQAQPYKEQMPVATGAGELAAEIGATLPVGGALAKGVTKAASYAPSIASKVNPLAEALRTGGFSAGGMTGASGLAVRGAGGAATGGASAALIDPNDAGIGAAIGGALPVVGKGLASGAQYVGRAMRPAEVKVAENLANQIGVPKEELLSALQQQGPQMIDGYQRTVPQILQNEFTSQLQRNLKTAGVNALGDVEKLQQGQFREALGRVAPIQDDTFTAAQRAGSAIQNFAVPARANATENVRNAFEAVDPFGETALHLPISEMERAAGKFLGAGTFGTGGRAAEAINTAKRVGTEELPAVKALTQKEIGKTQSLEQAVRSAGGIRDTGYLSKELQELGRKQSGTTGLIGKTGKDVERMAEIMYERGFLPDNDPATLLDSLRNKGGRNIFASDVTDNAFAGRLEASMGDLPEAQTISKAVPFQTVQNLRSSIGEAASVAEAKGANKEAAALRQMVGEIDSRINRAAGGNVGEGEFFPKDIADQYRKALGMHQEKMFRYETGPQASMFRKGGDGQASIQGAEIPSKFYNANLSQADDLKAFKRLINDNQALSNELKSFATTQMAGTESAMGNLGDKFVKFVQARSGSNKELFTPNELATIKEVAKGVQNQLRTEGLGRVSGSDTAQKLATLQSNGILDNRLLGLAANRTPIIGSFTGPMLQNLRDTALKTKNETLAKLLANPQEFANALQTPEGNKAIVNALRMSAPVARTMPVIAAD